MEDNTRKADYATLLILRSCKRYLGYNQYCLLRGQAHAGDGDGALKGLKSILNKRLNKVQGNNGKGG